MAVRQRWAMIKYRYGLTQDEWMGLLAKQGGKCAICARDLDHELVTRTTPGKACVDHDHETGVVRGLLCTDCNIGIGRLKHDPNVLTAALRYLGR